MAREEYVAGSWDIHVHAAPSLFPRWGDVCDLAELCIRNSMHGFVLKYHHGSSAESAYIANKLYRDIRIVGGITLNHFVGGLNIHAVDCAVSLGGRIVWLPTIHAENHRKTMGVLGGFSFQNPSTALSVEDGIVIVDDSGKIVEELKDILDLLNGKSVVLATGHISPEEIFTLHRYIRSEGLDIPLLVNHVFFRTTDLNEGQISELTDERTWFETVYLTVSSVAGGVPVEKVAGVMKKTPESHWIIASDTGQVRNIRSPEALSEYATMLTGEGISQKRIRKMLVDEPKVLLNIQQ